MSLYWSDGIEGLRPYSPGEQADVSHVVKLNTNESPYPPSPRVYRAIADAAADGLNLYPDPECTALREGLAAYHGLEANQIYVGNGSDEVLAYAFAALLKHQGPLLFPDVTYAFYAVYCGFFKIRYETVPLAGDFGIQIADYLRPGSAVVLANPNAPTGISLPVSFVVKLLEQKADKVVLIDEAYVDFGGESAIPLVNRFPNLLVTRTMSKSRGLAGLRVGYAVGGAELIEGLRRVRDSVNSYPVGRVAQAGALASLDDNAHFQNTIDQIVRGRHQLAAGLRGLGFDVLPSCANFVLARHPKHSGREVASALRRQNVLVRRFDMPRIEDHLRITVGTPAQLDRLLDSLETILKAS